MANHKEVAIFRNFAALNVKSLLYMRAKLVHLEDELKIIEEEDRATVKSKTSLPFPVHELKRSDDTEIQCRKYTEIREKLKVYNSALLQYQKIQKLTKPTSYEVGVLREWLHRPEGGDFFLKGREADTWQIDSELVHLSGQESEKDRLTCMISDKIVPWFYRRWGYRVQPVDTGEWDGVWEYSNERVAAIVTLISTVLASLLPISSMLVLNLFSDPVMRLVIIMLFTALFSVTLTVVSKSRRVDIFAATAV
ncbi:MAG: hypothetical protein Q9190_006124, partial [Brigantiaea leucoxantha]